MTTDRQIISFPDSVKSIYIGATYTYTVQPFITLHYCNFANNMYREKILLLQIACSDCSKNSDLKIKMGAGNHRNP